MSEVHPKSQPSAPRVAVPPSTCSRGAHCHSTPRGGWMCRCPKVPMMEDEAAYCAARNYVGNPDIYNPPTPEQVNALLSALLDHMTKPTLTVAAPVRAFPSAAIDPAFGGMELRDWFAGQALVRHVSQAEYLGMDTSAQCDVTAVCAVHNDGRYEIIHQPVRILIDDEPFYDIKLTEALRTVERKSDYRAGFRNYGSGNNRKIEPRDKRRAANRAARKARRRCRG